MATRHKQARQDIVAADFVRGMCLALRYQGWLSFDPNERVSGQLVFHLSMWQAFEHWRAQVDEEQVSIDFRIVLNRLHGDSLTVAEEISTMLSFQDVHLRSNGGGVYYFDIDRDEAYERMERNLIGRDVLLELVQRFCLQYRVPIHEREWPEGFEPDR